MMGMAIVEYQPPHENMRGPRCVTHGSIYVVGPFPAKDEHGSPVQRWQCSRCGGQWDIAKHVLARQQEA